MRTAVCDLLEIEYPIFGAGMGGVSGPAFAAAVSNAGGMGAIGATGVEPETLRDWIRKTKSLTDKPFAVDLLMPIKIPGIGTEKDLWELIPQNTLDFIETLRIEFGAPKISSKKFILTVEHARRAFEVICEEHVPVFASGLGTPAWVVPEAHSHGMKVISLVGNVKNAVKMVKQKADIIVAQGTEAGGHTGRIGTMALIPQVVDAISPVPVLAAGGIGDGRGLAAALALGGQGAWCGTRFVCIAEAFHEWVNNPGTRDIAIFGSEEGAKGFQQRIINRDEEGTTIARIYTGKTARLLKNDLITKWEKAGEPTLGMPMQTMAMGDLLAGLREINHEAAGFPSCGQVCGMIKEIKNAKEVVDEMVEQAAAILKNHAWAVIS